MIRRSLPLSIASNFCANSYSCPKFDAVVFLSICLATASVLGCILFQRESAPDSEGIFSLVGACACITALFTLGAALHERRTGAIAAALGAVGALPIALCAVGSPATIPAALFLLSVWLCTRMRWGRSVPALAALTLTLFALQMHSAGAVLTLLPLAVWSSARLPLWPRLALPMLAVLAGVFWKALPAPLSAALPDNHTPFALVRVALSLTLGLPALALAVPRLGKLGLRPRDERIRLLALTIVPSLGLPVFSPGNSDLSCLIAALALALAGALALAARCERQQFAWFGAAAAASLAVLFLPLSAPGWPTLAALHVRADYWSAAERALDRYAPTDSTLVVCPESDRALLNQRLPGYIALALAPEAGGRSEVRGVARVSDLVFVGDALETTPCRGGLLLTVAGSGRTVRMIVPPGARIGHIPAAGRTLTFLTCPKVRRLRIEGDLLWLY